MTPSLLVTDLTAGYGEVQVLKGVSLTARSQGVTAVIGSNGAGKSTLMRRLAGLPPHTGGQITFEGQDISTLASHDLVARGVVLVPEGRLIFSDMTVFENLTIGAVNPRARADRDNTLETVFDFFPRLKERRSQLGGTLSGGEQQMLALGRGLMANPKLLLLDEPTLGLAPGIAKQIFQIIPSLVKLGLSVILAEQDVHKTLAIADYVYVLENGTIGAEGLSADLQNDQRIKDAYLGA